MEKVYLDDYAVEKQCEYKGRVYIVRDNGAVMRLPKEGRKPVGLDNVWTFGKKDQTNGYMMVAGERVHQIVARAFHGVPSNNSMVVDHKDTNRCNNRPENLAWVTKFENMMNNPITRSKIEYICGSVEAFLENPAKWRDKMSDPNISWMCTVSKEEAEKCKRNLERWAAESKRARSSGNGLGTWVFEKNIESESEYANTAIQNLVSKPSIGEINSQNDSARGEAETWDTDWYLKTPRKSDYVLQMEEIERQNEIYYQEAYSPKDSLTPLAMQNNWKTLSEFPACPQVISDTPLEDYLRNIKKGEVFCTNNLYTSFSEKAELSDDKATLAVITSSDTAKGMGGYNLTTITFENGKFVHTSEGSYFHEDGAEKYFTLALGREWTGGEVMDDYC